MQKKKGKNNAQPLFGLFDIPSDNQIKNLLDAVSPVYVFPVFFYIFNGLSEAGYLDSFRSYNGDFILICKPDFHKTLYNMDRRLGTRCH